MKTVVVGVVEFAPFGVIECESGLEPAGDGIGEIRD